MKARELITNAWYQSGIVRRTLATVSGEQLKDGLRLLNVVLSEKSISGRYIPYYGHLTVPCVVGQQAYTIANLISADAITFNIGDVRFPMIEDQRREFWGTGRVDNIEALPYHYYLERVKGGLKIYLYFLPQDTFPLNITGKFFLSSVAADDDIDDEVDAYYVNYLELSLARYMCAFYKVPFPADSRLLLSEIESQMAELNPIDFSVNKISTLDSTRNISWSDINLGKGWTPS
jgi:hypothetical protein